jgi:hypothetical protein
MQFIDHITRDVHRALIDTRCASEHSKRRAACAAGAVRCASNGSLPCAWPAVAPADLR